MIFAPYLGDFLSLCLNMGVTLKMWAPVTGHLSQGASFVWIMEKFFFFFLMAIDEQRGSGGKRMSALRKLDCKANKLFAY